jgi:hypothetical protein
MPAKHSLLFLAVFSASPFLLAEAARFVPAHQRFLQEQSENFVGATGLPNGPVQLLDLGSEGQLRAFSGGSWSTYSDPHWTPESALKSKSAGEFTFAGRSVTPITVPLPWTDVQQLVRAGDVVWLTTSNTIHRVDGGRLIPTDWPAGQDVRQIAVDSKGVLAVASNGGLFQKTERGWQVIPALDAGGRAWAVRNVLGVGFDSQDRLWFASKAGVGCRTADGWQFREGKDGLPWNDFTGIAAGPGDEVWFGTHLGAVRWDGKAFHYRQGPRWLPDDDIRQVRVDRGGRAWFATASGLGQIRREPMTLAGKAEFYEQEVEQFVKRTPYGFTAEAPLKRRADKTSAHPHDSDNDGLWTAMYGAGECFAYGATHDAKALARATQAFEALRFLQKVTQGGKPSPPKGFVARTVRPSEWPDPNAGRIEGDREEAKRDGLWKVYEPRWPKSADGKWYWKSDTSSDELDGHYFFYAAYYDLVAEKDSEREQVREVVRDLSDHLLTHKFTLTDVDGTPTRWATYGPDTVNGDGRWWPERGLNSLSILSYLTVATHITGDPKYVAAARELVVKHGYAQNLTFPKVQFGPGSGNQSDDEMAIMCFYNLMKYGKDPEIRDRVLFAFYAYWAMEAPEMNPFFHFAFAAHGLGQSIDNVWGRFPVSPWAGWHEDSMATLRGFPLDRLNWPHRNSHRLDLVLLAPQKSKDLYDPKDRGRGNRVDGRVLPVENRHFEHWNTDPWDLDYGGNGDVLGSGTVFLLPYYLGLYHGFIEKP